MSSEINKASSFYTIYWDNILVGLSTYLPLPNGVIKYAWRNNRLVILPDYQNLGFGTSFLEFMGEYYLKNGLKYFERSSHLRLHMHMENSPMWVATSQNGKTSTGGGKAMWKYDNKRICYSYEYMGKDYSNKKHIQIICEESESFCIERFEKDIKKLKERYFITVVTGDIHSKTKIEEICLRNGIRTQLLYLTKNGAKTILKKYEKEEIIRNYEDVEIDFLKRGYKYV